MANFVKAIVNVAAIVVPEEHATPQFLSLAAMGLVTAQRLALVVLLIVERGHAVEMALLANMLMVKPARPVPRIAEFALRLAAMGLAMAPRLVQPVQRIVGAVLSAVTGCATAGKAVEVVLRTVEHAAPVSWRERR